RVKMINWFEWRKPEAEVGDNIVDWTATVDAGVRAAFAADLPSEGLLFASGPLTAEADALAPTDVVPTATAEPLWDARTGELTRPDPDPPGRLQFAGYEWRVRSAIDLEGPGPNYFSDSDEHAWVDDAGRLHLRVAPDADGRWYAAEVISTATFGYGTYEFRVDSRVDDLDPNVTLGLFTWSDDPAQNHRELDIEFALFGQPTGLAGRFTLQPYTEPGNVFLFEPPASASSTHRFEWLPQQIAFESSIDGGQPGTASLPVAQHVFVNSVPQPGGEHVHINLWLDAGNAPTDGRSVEIVLRDFAFKPAD
ncbi:MAG: glycoside hydrolase family 16 protein, partial [Chloroflexota bacterium]|nr:glycoside hydrolase family 16 protein [Chloroflexota bacterium]